jgi:hypothetical protein
MRLKWDIYPSAAALFDGGTCTRLMAPKNEQNVFLNHGMQCFMMFCVWEIMIDPILVDESPMDGCEINQTFTKSLAKPWEPVEC